MTIKKYLPRNKVSFFETFFRIMHSFEDMFEGMYVGRLK